MDRLNGEGRRGRELGRMVTNDVDVICGFDGLFTWVCELYKLLEHTGRSTYSE